MSKKELLKSNVAGLCVKGGKKDNFFLYLLDYFEESDRWFLKATLQFKGEVGENRDDAISKWLKEYKIQNLIVNFPLSNPSCKDCQLECPGISLCPDLSVEEVRFQSSKILEDDAKLHSKHPKSYEEERINQDHEKKFNKDLITKNSSSFGLISRAFRRRLKKKFLPYWNRTLDFWVWLNYFDIMYYFFKTSFDSFGSTSLMTLSRFSYMKKHFKDDLNIYESNSQLNLIEFYKAGIVSKDQIDYLSDTRNAYHARIEIIKNIEKKLGIFIYENDLDLIADHPLAFESFLLGVVGPSILKGNIAKMPDWTLPDKTRFIIPHFPKF